MGQLTPTHPPSTDNTTTASQAGRQAASQPGRACKIRADRTNSTVLSGYCRLRQTICGAPGAPRPEQRAHLLTRRCGELAGTSSACTSKCFFPQFTNTDRKHHRKCSSRSVSIGRTVCHVTAGARPRGAAILVRGKRPLSDQIDRLD